MSETIEQDKAESSPPAIKIMEIYKRYSGRRRGLPGSHQGYLDEGFFKSVFFGKEWETIALNRVSFSVDHGEVFGLLGPNGSGKTTLIKILTNLVLPDSGSAYVEGINVARRPYAASKKLQTVLAESIGLEKRITARQNLQLFASLYGLPKKEADDRIDRSLEYFGLTFAANSSSQVFSTGMSRKLSICRVLLSDASVIVFDEPTAGLDPSAAEDLRRLILGELVKRQKKTVLMATHNLAEANSMCTRIGLLNNGKLLAIGSPEEIRKSVEDQVDISITLSGTSPHPEELKRKLGEVDGIYSVEMAMMQGTEQVRLTGRKDLNYLGVFSLVSTGGLRVVSVDTSSASLEDAFFRLTRGAKK